MKKKFIALFVLCVLMLSFTLTSCNREIGVQDVAAKIYTLYTICNEPTTPEAIRQVEINLNYLTFYQLGICVKLVMTTPDKYEKLIDEKFAELQAYEAEKKANGKDKDNEKTSTEPTASGTGSAAANSSSSTSKASSDTSSDVFTGEEYIDMLKEGKEYVFKNPRLDIFLINGFENYFDYVVQEKLAALDEKLQSEAKLIKSNIHSNFLDAAKISDKKGMRKTYGIPMNTGIGEYEYVIFDKELLEKYKIDASTMKTLEDLEYYLRIIKENEPDVVPLANAFDSPAFTYLFTDGFPAYVNNHYVVDPYEDAATLNYYTTIARYRTLGYLD
ncbi:MAG: hypothetical protein RR057_01175, partial [Clostridia bacterium]